MFSDHQNPTASMERWKVLLEHCTCGNSEEDDLPDEPAMLEEMQSGPIKNLT